ncbi:MAG: hypothetical protein M1829_003583 [Trizodia sp. TS-e1964]|nr:MAG: hypothetical protein M1829_003583 [Trizodia sp. TS-e1964]
MTLMAFLKAQQGLESLCLEQPFQPIHDTSSVPSISSSRDDEGLAQNAASSTEVFLPSEVIFNILSFIPRRASSQPTLHACSLVSRQWYAAAVLLLYERPHISGRNFKQFVATICPSVNAHVRKSELAILVKALDMGYLVHDGSRSLTARILGRLKGGLEEFVAPQASFAINCFAALAKCSRLRHLDLSLVSDSIALSDLFRVIKPLSQLSSLRFPRSSNYDRGFTTNSFSWPPNLESLHLAGGVSDNFLLNMHNPPRLSSLTIEHCPFAKPASIRTLLAKLAPQLTRLKVSYHIPLLPFNGLDNILLICPNLVYLSIAVDFITDHFFQVHNFPPMVHPLEMLELECSGNVGVAQKFGPNEIYIAVCGALGKLRRVRLSERLGWQDSKEFISDIKDLVDLLETKEYEDWTGQNTDENSEAEAMTEPAESKETVPGENLETPQTGINEIIKPLPVQKAGVWTFTNTQLSMHETAAGIRALSHSDMLFSDHAELRRATGTSSTHASTFSQIAAAYYRDLGHQKAAWAFFRR